MWPDFTGVLNCRAHVNTHIVVITCIFNCCFHTAVSLLCLFHYWEESTQYIFTYSSKCRSSSATFCSEALCVSSSLELHPGELNYTLALQCHTRTTRQQKYLSTIMSTNRFSPTIQCVVIGQILQACDGNVTPLTIMWCRVPARRHKNNKTICCIQWGHNYWL